MTQNCKSHLASLLGIGSVSADMNKSISVIYQIGQFKKGNLLVHIGIGRYENRLYPQALPVSSSQSKESTRVKEDAEV